MSMVAGGQGKCVCGESRIFASAKSHSVSACHCGVCRKWGGGPLMVVECGSDVTFESENNITVFDSSEWAERGFCNLCGTHLFYRLKENQYYFIPVGLFEHDPDYIFDHQVFIEEKPDYYAFANETDEITGEELFAKFASPEE